MNEINDFLLEQGGLLALGWGKDKVKTHYQERAIKVTAGEYEIKGFSSEDHSKVKDFFMSEGLSIELSADQGGLIALDSNRMIVAAIILSRTMVGARPVTVVQYLQVTENLRRMGLGTVLCGLSQTLKTHDRGNIYLTRCASESARFFQKMGYSVLQSGIELAISDFSANSLGFDFPKDRCWALKSV